MLALLNLVSMLCTDVLCQYVLGKKKSKKRNVTSHFIETMFKAMKNK